MKWLDRVIRDLRIAQAVPFVREGDRLLDIGCFDQTLLRRVAGRIRSGVGIDPLAQPAAFENVRILRSGILTEGAASPLSAGSFDCITMLAVLEHIPDTGGVARECARLLAPGGRLVITVPKPQVDAILLVLKRMGLLVGCSLEQHHGYDVGMTRPTFEAEGLKLIKHKTFEFGLNCLFVFEKPASPRVIVRESALAEVVGGV